MLSNAAPRQLLLLWSCIFVFSLLMRKGSIKLRKQSLSQSMTCDWGDYTVQKSSFHAGAIWQRRDYGNDTAEKNQRHETAA